MTSRRGEVSLDLTVTDADGHETSLIVPVLVEYVAICDPDYGADADGQRGTPSFGIEGVEFHIDRRHLLKLTFAQVEDLIMQAKQRITKDPSRFYGLASSR